MESGDRGRLLTTYRLPYLLATPFNVGKRISGSGKFCGTCFVIKFVIRIAKTYVQLYNVNDIELDTASGTVPYQLQMLVIL